MIKKLVWAIPVSIGGVAVAGTAIGLGYTGSLVANPYVDFFRRPAYNTVGGLTDAYMSAVTNGAKVVVGAGFTHTNPITTAVSQSFFMKNKIGFVLLDDAFNKQNDNGYTVASITFRISEAAFLSGIALGEYLNYYQDIFAPGTDDRLTYAAWGGMIFGTVLSFMSGFQQGINYFNNILVPKINSNNLNGGKTYKVIHQITSATSFSGGFAPQDGKKVAEELMNGSGTKTWSIYKQAEITNNSLPSWTNQDDFKVIAEKEIPDAVLVAAGPQVSVAIDEINKNNTKTVIIGVDVAQENDLALNREYTAPLVNSDGTKKIEKPISFSIMKDLANTTNKVLGNIKQGYATPSDQGNTSQLGGLGWNSKGDLDNEGVSVSDAGKPFLYNALVKSGLLSGGLVIDNPADLKNISDLNSKYNQSKEIVKKQPDYLYNQGTRGTTSGIDYVPDSDFKNSSEHPGYQLRNQYVAPYTDGGVGSKPSNLVSQSYVFEDNIISQSIVKDGDEQKHKDFVKYVSDILQNDISNSNNNINVETLKNDVKVVLSESTTVLLDNSFSQSAFEGILRFLATVDSKNFGSLYENFQKNILHINPTSPTNEQKINPTNKKEILTK